MLVDRSGGEASMMSSFIRHCCFPPSSSPPSDELAQRIRNRDWDGACHRLYLYPVDAQYRTENQSTPLHLACLYRAPCQVVQRVLEAFPQALLLVDNQGWTALHACILYGADEDTALLLLKRGGAPAAAVQSRWVGSPLSVACRHGVSIPVLEALLEANGDMVRISETGTATPAALLWYFYTKNPDHEEVVTRLKEGCGTISEKDPGVADLLLRLRLLLTAADRRPVEDANEPNDRLLLHRVLVHECDLDLRNFVPLVMRLYPEQAKRVDSMGRLPLHLAASGPTGSAVLAAGRQYRGPLKNSIELLVNAYPKAARVLNGDGRLAIHIALDHGRRNWDTGVCTLIKAAPEALLTRDVQSHLYPVLLAAAHPVEDDVESLNTIFELLQAYPPVVQHGLQS